MPFWLAIIHILAVSSVVVLAQWTTNILLFLFPSRQRRRVLALIQRAWADGVGVILPQSDLRCIGDIPDPNEPTILLPNHQVDADWWYIWILCKHFSMHGNLKIILKAALKWVPIIGWGMQSMEFIFLKRKWAEDQAGLLSKVQSLMKDHLPVWILIFPEGTTIHKEALDKGNEFAKQHNRPVTRNLLSPRTTGFEAIMESMGKDLKYVYDISMIYTGFTGEIPTWNDGYTRKKDKQIPHLGRMITGEGGEPVYLVIRKHSVQDIKSKGVEKWLDERWTEKDALLAQFATSGKLPELKGDTFTTKDKGELWPITLTLFVTLFTWFAISCIGVFTYHWYTGTL